MVTCTPFDGDRPTVEGIQQFWDVQQRLLEKRRVELMQQLQDEHLRYLEKQQEMRYQDGSSLARAVPAQPLPPHMLLPTVQQDFPQHCAARAELLGEPLSPTIRPNPMLSKWLPRFIIPVLLVFVACIFGIALEATAMSLSAVASVHSHSVALPASGQSSSGARVVSFLLDNSHIAEQAQASPNVLFFGNRFLPPDFKTTSPAWLLGVPISYAGSSPGFKSPPGGIAPWFSFTGSYHGPLISHVHLQVSGVQVKSPQVGATVPIHLGPIYTSGGDGDGITPLIVINGVLDTTNANPVNFSGSERRGYPLKFPQKMLFGSIYPTGQGLDPWSWTSAKSLPRFSFTTIYLLM
jgi:hypothetical protein